MDERTKALAKRAAGRTWTAVCGAVSKGGSAAAGYASDRFDDIKRSREPLSESNWYERAERACEGVGDAILNDKPGTSQRLVRAAAGKLGMVGVPAAIFSTASLIGTASTGTAIGSLSGAAFSSAALAWIGGSVAMGGVIIGVATVAGGIGAVLGAGWAAKKYFYGRSRKKSELDEQERRIVDACLALSLAFRNERKAGRGVDPIASGALYHDALKPLCDELLEYQIKAESWPLAARKRLAGAVHSLGLATSFALRHSRAHPNFTTGIVGAVITQLLADDIPEFDDNEQLVLDALRRSKSSLAEASDQELADYVQSLQPDQLQGLSNNLLGISHELRYYVEENSDGDEYIVELFATTNHPGADAKIINTLTGEVREVQLKASQFLSYVQRHNERYADIPVLATEEVASRDAGIESSGISHAELSEDVDDVVSGLRDVDDPGILTSMSVAGMVTLARNVRVLLKGNQITAEEKSSLVRGGVHAALVSGLVHTVIG